MPINDDELNIIENMQDHIVILRGKSELKDKLLKEVSFCLPRIGIDQACEVLQEVIDDLKEYQHITNCDACNKPKEIA